MSTWWSINLWCIYIFHYEKKLYWNKYFTFQYKELIEKKNYIIFISKTSPVFFNYIFLNSKFEGVDFFNSYISLLMWTWFTGSRDTWAKEGLRGRGLKKIEEELVQVRYCFCKFGGGDLWRFGASMVVWSLCNIVK